MTLERIVCGFQSGADIGAARAARTLGVPTAGFMPKGYRTEAGPRPEYAAEYGAAQHPSPEYPPRTRANVALADLTLIFNVGDRWSRGTKLGVKEATALDKPFAIVELVRVSPTNFNVDHLVRPFGAEPAGLKHWTVHSRGDAGERVAAHLRRSGVRSLCVAGNRESDQPGIGPWVERFMGEVLANLARPP